MHVFSPLFSPCRFFLMHLINKPKTEFTGQVWPMPTCSVMKGGFPSPGVWCKRWDLKCAVIMTACHSGCPCHCILYCPCPALPHPLRICRSPMSGISTVDRIGTSSQLQSHSDTARVRSQLLVRVLYSGGPIATLHVINRLHPSKPTCTFTAWHSRTYSCRSLDSWRLLLLS